MWPKRKRPAALVTPDDIGEAVALREETCAERALLRKQAPLVEWMTTVLINRQGENHYMETLYKHVPKGV